jgi:hypothetical protein
LKAPPRWLRARSLRNKELRRQTPHILIPLLRASSEPLHNSINTEGSRCGARSEATTSFSSQPPHHARASPETQLNQEGHLHTGRGVADVHELIDHALDTLLIDEGARKQQVVEQEKDEGNSEDEDEGPRQEMNVVAPVVTAERAGESPRPANRRQSLPNLEQFPEPNHNEAGSRSDCDSDDELNSSDSAENDEKEPRPAKRKQPSSSHGGLARKKRRRPLQQNPPRQRRPLNPIASIPSHTPLSTRGQESLRARVPRAGCLHRRLLCRPNAPSEHLAREGDCEQPGISISHFG